MTREEREDAKDIIQSILDKYEEDECLVTEITIGDEDIKAFKMAIKALKQEPTTKNDLGVDCISRDDVWDVMQELWGTSGELMDRLMALPPVTPHKKTAHWIGEEYDGYADGAPVYTSWVCSECGATFMCEDMDFLYCPRCGSVMEV